MKRGVTFAVGAYAIWGVSPIFWKLIKDIPALEIVGHRIVWSFILVFGLTAILKKNSPLKGALKDRRVLLIFSISASLLLINWVVYILAINSGFIVDASLGYFINPLVSVCLGVIFLKEKLRIWQWIPVGIAFFGVIYLTISYGSLPWIGLTLAFTFGIYGLLKKRVGLDSLNGFTLETGLMLFPAIVYLLILESNGLGSFGHVSAFETILLFSTGILTALPLVLFGSAAQSINLSTLGFIQYIAPTLQFIIGVYLYGEAFTQDRLIGFGMIWFALAIFTIESIIARQKPNIPTPAD